MTFWGNEPHFLERVGELLRVLLDPVFHDARAVPDGPGAEPTLTEVDLQEWIDRVKRSA